MISYNIMPSNTLNVELIIFFRYKLALLVQDLTGESNFNLLDSAATFIVKISAAKVVNQWFDEVIYKLF